MLARGVVMAGGGWMNKRVVRDMPASHMEAYGTFNHAPMLVANVALNNWRFMYKAGVTACLYNGEFGFECNIRKPMQTGSYQPPLHPDQPTILTFYVPFPTLGMDTRAQAMKGRWALYGASYADYELKIRRQLTELFGQYGFDAGRDIEGIILNRWDTPTWCRSPVSSSAMTASRPLATWSGSRRAALPMDIQSCAATSTGDRPPWKASGP